MRPAVLTRILSLLLSAMLAATFAIPADAQPSNADPAPVVSLTWRTLGVNADMYLGPESPTAVTMPVPTGLNAVRVQGLIQAPKNINAGFLEVTDSDGRLLASVPLPPTGTAPPSTPLDVDVAAAPVRANSVALTFTLRTTDDADQFCGPLQQVHLTNLSTVFGGTESPATTIATFFPPVLQQVSVYAPADADPAEQQAVLTLVSTLVRMYQPQPLAVRVITQPRGAVPPPAPPLGRAILVESGGTAGLNVVNPGSPEAYLRLSGKGDELTTQVSLLVNRLQSLVQTGSSRVDQAGADDVPTGDTLTFSQLKMSGKADVLRRSTVSVGVDRSALGNGRVNSVQVHLLADYTPVPDEDAASVVIQSDNVVVFQSALNDSGRLDATFDLPSQTLTQTVKLDMTLTYTPHQSCGPLVAPMSFQVDPRSTLTLHRGGPPLAGFSAVPSEFSPSFMVALDGSGPGQLIDAARVVAAIASLSGRQLTPQVVPLQTAVDSRSGALIVAKSEAIEKTSLNPPVGGNATSVDVGLPTELRADIADGLGSIQAFADPPRDRSVVLVTTTDAWSLVDPLLDYIDSNNGGWSALGGDVLAAGAAGTPTTLTLRAGADEFTPPNEASSSNHTVPLAIGIAVLAALLLVTAIVITRRRRPRRVTVKPTATESS